MKLNENASNLSEFENSMTDELKTLWDEFQTHLSKGINYKQLKIWQHKLQPHGLMFEFGMDSSPYDFEIIKYSCL